MGLAGPKAYLHAEIATDKRHPTVNANGRIYGSPEESTDLIPILDPAQSIASSMKMPVRDVNTPSSKDDPLGTSPYWGDEPIWDSQTSPHNPMFDEHGRVWFTSRVRHLPPISFPGCPERWWGDEALKAETDAPQATLEQ